MTTSLANTDRVERIRALLAEQLRATAIEVIDDSHLHAGHAGARDGRGHVRVRIVSSAFAGLRPLQRHQLVYRSLGEMMQNDIHALSIAAHSPDELPSDELGT
jgi:BolA family transcriptional regulator, general stress-responsive regulator